MKIDINRGLDPVTLRLLTSIFISVILLMLTACPSIPSFYDWVKPIVGQPISLLEKPGNKGNYKDAIGWQDRRYNLRNGNWVYVEPIRDGCLVHFEVNPQGIIVGYQTEGDRCY